MKIRTIVDADGVTFGVKGVWVPPQEDSFDEPGHSGYLEDWSIWLFSDPDNTDLSDYLNDSVVESILSQAEEDTRGSK